VKTTHYRYLIVGGGLTAHNACRGIRERDQQGKIGLISSATVAPYAPPPLTKGLWKGDKEESIWCDTGKLDVELLLNRTVNSVDPDESIVTDADGNSYHYDSLLLATGGSPRKLPVESDEIIYFRTLEDYQQLRLRATPGSEIAVLGGGFIGSELAAALSGQGCRITLIFPEQAIGGRVLTKELSGIVTNDYEGHGVKVMPKLSVTGISRAGEKLMLSLSNGKQLPFDVVVAGLGITPETRLAEACGLRTEDGILVNQFAQVEGKENIFAAGDVALFPCLPLNTTLRVEHEDHAIQHGRLAGMNMAGAKQPYEHLPFFYSDLFDNGYEAVGLIDNRKPCVVEWTTPGEQATVYYLDEQRRPTGIMTWNSFGKMDQARELISNQKSIDTSRLK